MNTAAETSPTDVAALVDELRRARTALVRTYVLHVAWFAIMCTLAGLRWHRGGVEVSVLFTLVTVPPVLFQTVRVHRLCRRIDPAAHTVGWIPVLVTTFVLSPFESGLILPAKNLFAANRILRAYRTSAMAAPCAPREPRLMSIAFRPEQPRDTAAIRRLTVAAFLDAPHAGHTEQFIVDALREAGQLAVSLVADDGDDIVGHVAMSPVAITCGVEGWYGLGPVSVAPARQRQGIGTRLVELALQALRERGAAGCVVLGEPAYYGRFGFRADPALLLPGVPPAYFQCVVLRGARPSGTVSYSAAFDATA